MTVGESEGAFDGTVLGSCVACGSAVDGDPVIVTLANVCSSLGSTVGAAEWLLGSEDVIVICDGTPLGFDWIVVGEDEGCWLGGRSSVGRSLGFGDCDGAKEGNLVGRKVCVG